MKRANMYLTNSKELVLVIQNPNEGWVFCHFRLEENNIIRIVNTGLPNMSSEFTRAFKDLFPNTKSLTHSVFPVKTMKKNFEFTKDVSKMVLTYDYTPYEPQDSDLSATLLQDYIDSITENDFTCEEFKNNTRTSLLPKKKLNAHNPWASKALDQSRLESYESPLKKTDIMFTIKQDSKLFKDIVAFLEADNPLVKHKNVLLFGPAATGKTTVAEAIATHYNLPYASLVGNARMEAEDLAGSVSISVDDEGDSAWVIQFTNVLQVAGAGGVCLFDEVLQLEGNTQASANSMLFGTKRNIRFQGRDYPISEHTIFIAATNVGYEGVGRANFAFKDRFRPFKTHPLTRAEIVEFYKLVFKRSLKAAAIRDYVDLCFDIDTYLENNYADTDEFNLERPQLTVRRMNDMIGEMLAQAQVKPILRSTLEGIMNSDSFTASDIDSLMDYFEKRLDELDNSLFTNSAYIEEASELAEELNTYTHKPKPLSNKPSKSTKVDKRNGALKFDFDNDQDWDDEDDLEDEEYSLDVEETEEAPSVPHLFDDEHDETKSIEDDLAEADALVEDYDV